MKRTAPHFWFGVIGALIISAFPAASYAQSVASLTAGTRVRVKTQGTTRWRNGYIQSTDSAQIRASTTSPAESISTAPEAMNVWTVPISSVTRVEISRGRGGSAASRIIAGALLGGLTGGVVVGGIGYMATRCTNCEESGIGILAGPMLGAPIGLLMGAIMGLASSRERWVPVRGYSGQR